MRIRSKLGKLMVIGIVLAIIGFSPGRLDVQGQQRTTQADQGLVRVVQAKPVESRPTMESKPPPAPLSRADKQLVLQSVLMSLRQQQKLFPRLNLDKMFPLSGTPLLSPDGVRIVLSPTNPYNTYGGTHNWLTFYDASITTGLGSDNNAVWEESAFGVELDVRIATVPGRTYLLDFSVYQRPYPRGTVPMEVNVAGNLIEMNPTNGHVLVPFMASASYVDVQVRYRFIWEFYSVEIIPLTLN